MKKVTLLFTLVVSLLSACVPATTTLPGGSASNPINTSLGIPSDIVQPGATWYFVSGEYNPEAFDFGLSGRNRAFSNSSQSPAVGQKRKSTINVGFSIKDFEAPEGWNVALERTYLEREIKDVSFDSYSFLDSVNFIFAVSIPEGATQSVETIIVTVQHGSASQKIPLIVLIDSDQPQAAPLCDDCTQS